MCSTTVDNDEGVSKCTHTGGEGQHTHTHTHEKGQHPLGKCVLPQLMMKV